VSVVGFVAVTVLACLMHWYESMMYVVPVLAVGGWGWWNTKRTRGGAKTPPRAPHAG
jgi:hypothetical protein